MAAEGVAHAMSLGAKAWKRRQIALGRCIQCGRRSRTGKRRCRLCAQKAVAHSARRREQALASYRCPMCWGPLDAGFASCAPCRSRERARQRAHRELSGPRARATRRASTPVSRAKRRDRYRMVVAERVASGICRCGAGVPAPDRKQCAECAERKRVAMRELYYRTRASKALAGLCSSTTCKLKRRPGRSMCAKHLEKMRLRARSKYRPR